MVSVYGSAWLLLHDERLERERLEREAQQETRAAAVDSKRQRRDGEDREEGDDDDAATATEGGHINLFPKAKEAELRPIQSL